MFNPAFVSGRRLGPEPGLLRLLDALLPVELLAHLLALEHVGLDQVLPPLQREVGPESIKRGKLEGTKPGCEISPT